MKSYEGAKGRIFYRPAGAFRQYAQLRVREMARFWSPIFIGNRHPHSNIASPSANPPLLLSADQHSCPDSVSHSYVLLTFS